MKFRSGGFCVRLNAAFAQACTQTFNFPKNSEKPFSHISSNAHRYLVRIPHKWLQLFTLQFILKARVISFGTENFPYKP